MTSPSGAATGSGSPLIGLIATCVRLFESMPKDIIAILARVIIGLVFWRSGQTKIEGFALKESTFFLFQEEYKLPVIPPDIAAYLATTAELSIPILLWVGLGARFGAAALLLMTLVIQTFVYPDAYMTHGLWAIALLFLIVNGAGTFSLDHFIRRRFMGDR